VLTKAISKQTDASQEMTIAFGNPEMLADGLKVVSFATSRRVFRQPFRRIM
jgi:hypothetical protein